MKELEASEGRLKEKIMSALRARFRGYGHCPSEQHWAGLDAVAEFVQQMADGTAKPHFAYSALPTGMGKTSLVIEAVRALVSDPHYRDVGVVIFVNLLEQIPILVRDMGLQPDQFAVVTGANNEELNQMGRGHFSKTGSGNWISEHHRAQVLFTTQQKLLHIAKHKKDFETFFKFDPTGEGEKVPRRVRIWDEAILPAKTEVLSRDNILKFIDRLITHDLPRHAEQYFDWLQNDFGDDIAVAPDPFDLHWITFEEAQTIAASGLFVDDETGATLARLSGKKVRVFHDDISGSGQASAIGYTDVLPDNFAPLLVLDASGQLRVTYKAWAEGRGDLVQLPSAGKSYRNLRIHHWDRAAGLAVHRDNAEVEELAKGVLCAFQEVPAREMLLIVHRLPEKEYASLADRIRAKAKAEYGQAGLERLRFVTWGRHMASNAFADIRHVVAIGMLQYPPPVIEATWRAANGTPIEKDVTSEEFEATRLGEVKHHLFQAVGRGAVRRCVDGDVPEGCKLWVIYSTHGRMQIPRTLLGEVFPGATVEAWEPFGVRLRTSRLKTDKRGEFCDDLMIRLGTAETVDVRAADFAGRFHPSMVHRFLRDDAIRGKLAAAGVAMSVRAEKIGRTKRDVHTLRRGAVAKGQVACALAAGEQSGASSHAL